ncbi:hypothetical protein [Thermanaerosceptrum fracticalcis]|nr:hypothetical protein [Thermanaerosceptrum fracticalcis]
MFYIGIMVAAIVLVAIVKIAARTQRQKEAMRRLVNIRYPGLK